MTAFTSIVHPATDQEVAEAVEAVALLGMPLENAKVFIAEMQSQGFAAAREIEQLIATLNDLGHTACAQRDQQRELAEVWSTLSCENAIEVARLSTSNRRLRLLLKEALDWLAGIEHNVALSIRLRAEALE